MNKTKKVAWHKHLKKAKKHEEKMRAEAGRPVAGPTTSPTTGAATRRPAAAPRRP